MIDPSSKLYLENQLCFPLYAASRLTTKIYTPLLNEVGLTYPQYLVLLVLWQHGDMSVNDIGDQLYLESNTLTPLLKRLESKGLIRRVRSEKDERSVLVSLTEEGAALKETVINIPERIAESFQGSALNEEEVLKFQKTLFELIDALDENLKSNAPKIDRSSRS